METESIAAGLELNVEGGIGQRRRENEVLGCSLSGSRSSSFIILRRRLRLDRTWLNAEREEGGRVNWPREVNKDEPLPVA